MNTYTVLELADEKGEPTGKHHFTRNHRPHGYCADNCPGHPTREEAYEHYRQYLLDNARFESGKSSNTLHRCQVKGCQNYSGIITRIPNESFFFLCDEHRNREGLDALVVASDSWASW